MWVAYRDAFAGVSPSLSRVLPEPMYILAQITYPVAEREELNAIVYMLGIVATVSSN